jgi:hypothetical protein
MFCAFSGSPQILRLFGRGQVVLPATPEWDELAPHFTLWPGTRQIITADIETVQTSCGHAVPLMTLEGERDTLTKWADAKGEDGMAAYQRQKNQRSLDGLITPIGLRCAHEA